MKSSKWLLGAVLASSLALVACGGGGGGAGSSPFVPDTGSPIAADLDVSPSAVQLANTSTSKVTVKVTALDSGKRAISNVKVNVVVAQGSDAVVTQLNSVTDTNGQVTAEITAGANKSNRTINIIATSGTVSKTTSLQVVGATITSTLSAPVISPNANGTIRYRVVDQATNPMINQSVQVTAPGFTPSSITGVTDVNGEYVYSFKTPSATGQFTVATQISGARNESLISVQPASSVPEVPADTAITSASVSANPSVVAVNTSGTQNRTEIRALFAGVNNSAVKNVRVRFDLNNDGSSVGGSFTNQGAVVYSDSNGIATTAYVPGSRPSPTNGVSVRACYGKTDADLANGACPNSVFTTLTIVNDPLGVTIGTDGQIIVNAAKLTYIRKYVVQVVDSAGNAKGDVNLSVSVDLPWYLKGDYCRGDGLACNPLGDRWMQVPNAICLNEDANRNGILEGIAEDVNGNNRLEPGKSDVKVLLLDTKTGADGLALLQIEYPMNYASWVAARVTVSASGILGTEGRASYLEDPVPVPVDAIKNKDAVPPFLRSPYGSGSRGCIDPN